MPSECAERSRGRGRGSGSRGPTASIVDAKSPKPSIVRIAASSNGETKTRFATCAWWCSTLWICARSSSLPSARARSSCTPPTLRMFRRRSTTYAGLRRRRALCFTFAARFARGSRPIATWRSSSRGSRPASRRHHAAASDGKPATCLTRLKRSSSAAATSSPSITRAAPRRRGRRETENRSHRVRRGRRIGVRRGGSTRAGGQEQQRDGRARRVHAVLRRPVIEERPTETVDHAGHRVEREHPAVALRDDRHRVDHRRRVEPDLHEERHDVRDVAVAHVQRGEPQARPERRRQREQQEDQEKHDVPIRCDSVVDEQRSDEQHRDEEVDHRHEHRGERDG